MWPNSQETVDLFRFTEETINGKLHFLCSRCIQNQVKHLKTVNYFHKKFHLNLWRDSEYAFEQNAKLSKMKIEKVCSASPHGKQ